jgi:hypothetical protein
MAFDYQSWIKAAEDRLVQLRQQRTTIDDEIVKLETALKGFAPLVDAPSTWEGPDAGLTDSMRQIFKDDARFWSPTELRDELLNRGVKLEQQNPMASIHQIITRLVKQDLIRPVDIAGKTKYQSKMGESKSDTRQEVRITARKYRVPDKKL